MALGCNSWISMASESQLESHADNPMVPVLARVISRREETTDIVTLDVVADNWTGFSPGQFNMLSVFGVGEIPISMSGDPRDCSKITHTIRAVGAVSRVALPRWGPPRPSAREARRRQPLELSTTNSLGGIP